MDCTHSPIAFFTLRGAQARSGWTAILALLSGSGVVATVRAPTGPPPAAAQRASQPDCEAVEAALERYGGVVARASRDLGLSGQALYLRKERSELGR